MVHHQRLIIHNQLKTGERFGEEGGCLKRLKPKILSLLLLSLFSCSFIVAPHIFSFSSTFSLLDSFVRESEGLDAYKYVVAPLCSSIPNGSICCDRIGYRSDICIMRGDVRTHSPSSSLFLYTTQKDNAKNDELQLEKIKPYTRKWETSVMDTVQELNLIRKPRNSRSDHSCDVYHDVPAVFFSTGGYTGNVYHEFNDGIIPLYVTSQHFNKRVVFVIVEYHNWWMMKYGDIVSQLSDYEPVDFSGDTRIHCFTEAIVGLKIHDELTVDPALMQRNKSIVDFRNVLDRAYWPRIRGLIQEEQEAKEKAEREETERNRENISLSPSSNESFRIDNKVQEDRSSKPKLVILSRNGSRAIINEDSLVKTAEEIGFWVEVLKPDRTTELAKVYRSLNSSDVMVGVHGAAMTHLLFMKPKSVFIQIIPLGTNWAAETYYGEPSKKLGLNYIGYEILPKESSLYDEYGKDDPIVWDPDSFTNRGWEHTKKIYLQHQNVKLEMTRFKKRLIYAYDYSVHRTNR